MPAISAVDAVSLAIQRTKEFLFRPFRWGTYLKLGLVAIVTEGIGSNFHSASRHGRTPTHGPAPLAHGPVLDSPFNLAPVEIAAIVAAVLLAIVISILVFYLITRLRFAFFHCLIHKTTLLRPGWRLYAPQAMRFFWLNIAVGFCFLLLVVLVAIPFATGFFRLFHEAHRGGPFPIGLLLSLALPLIPVILLLVVAGFLTDLILRDWMLPHFALEDATAGQAWASVRARIMAEKKEFFVYSLLRLVLPTIAIVGLFMLLIVPGLAVTGIFAAIEWGVHSAFADATGSSAVVGILLQVFFGLVAVVYAILAGICLGGPLSTGLREYALIFYGGRYAVLGDILFPPPSSPPQAESRRV